jgi:hypothetical protein
MGKFSKLLDTLGILFESLDSALSIPPWACLWRRGGFETEAKLFVHAPSPILGCQQS